ARCLPFLPPFGAPAFACWVILRPLGLCASLTVSLPSHLGPHRGCHVARARDPTGVGALYTPGVRCPHGRHRPSSRRWPPHSGAPLYPGTAFTFPGLGITERRQGFTHVHLSGLPRCLYPRVEREPLGACFGLHTPPLPATHAEAGTGTRALARNHVTGINRPPQHIHSPRGLSCRTPANPSSPIPSGPAPLCH